MYILNTNGIFFFVSLKCFLLQRLSMLVLINPTFFTWIFWILQIHFELLYIKFYVTDKALPGCFLLFHSHKTLFNFPINLMLITSSTISFFSCLASFCSSYTRPTNILAYKVLSTPWTPWNSCYLRKNYCGVNCYSAFTVGLSLDSDGSYWL